MEQVDGVDRVNMMMRITTMSPFVLCKHHFFRD